MPRDARITDLGSHGPMIITGAKKTIVANQHTSRIGDIYDCPEHGPNPIVTGSMNYINENAAMAKIGDLTACGAVIVTGAASHIHQ